MKKNTEQNLGIKAENVNDEGLELKDQTQNFIQKNSKIIIIVSVAVILIVALIVIMRNKAQNDSEQASALISRVLPYYETADYPKALDGDPQKTYLGEPVRGFKYIVSEYGSTEQGKLAALYTGNILLSTAKYSEAKEYFEKASNADSKLVQQGALAGLAACLESENKFEEAAKNYEDAASLSTDDELQARYSFYAGLAYEKNGNKDKAEKIYREIVKKTKFSEFNQLAKAGLIRIGTIIE